MKIVIPTRMLLFPCYHAKRVNFFNVGGGTIKYVNCLTPSEMQYVYCVLYLLGKKDFVDFSINKITNLVGGKRQNVSRILNYAIKSEITFEGCFQDWPIKRVKYFDIERTGRGKSTRYIASPNSGFIDLYSLNYTEIDLSIFSKLKPLEKRCYEYHVFDRWAKKNKGKNTSRIDYDLRGDWIGIRDPNHSRKEKTIKSLISKMKSIGLVKKSIRRNDYDIEYEEAEEITGEIPRFKKKKDPAPPNTHRRERDAIKNESGVITQPPQEVNAKVEEVIDESANKQQQRHSHHEPTTSEDSLLEIKALVDEMRNQFQGRKIEFDTDLIWQMVLKNIITEEQAKERFEIFFMAWPRIKERELYKIKSEFNSFGGAVRTFFKDGKDWFSKYIQKRKTTTVERDPQASQQKEAEKQNKRAAFFKVWDNANEAVRYNAYKRAEKNNPMSKGKPKFLASAVAHEFAKGVFSDDEVSVNFLCDEDFAIITGDIQDYMKPVSW